MDQRNKKRPFSSLKDRIDNDGAHSPTNTTTKTKTINFFQETYINTANGHQVANHRKQALSSYFERRHQKLKAQGEAQISSLFQGLTFYIDGYTGPKISDIKLRALIQQHGGELVLVFGKRTVTHVICTSLAERKKELWVHQSKNIINFKIVTPNWVIDSVQHGKTLSEAGYQVVESSGSVINSCLTTNVVDRTSNDPLPSRVSSSKNDQNSLSSPINDARFPSQSTEALQRPKKKPKFYRGMKATGKIPMHY